MVAILQSEYASGKLAAPTPCGSEVCSYRASYTFATGDLVLNNIVDMAVLPANCTLLDAVLDSDDLDSNASPTITLDVGVMSGDVGSTDNTRTCGAEVFSQDTTAQAGGVKVPSLKTAYRVAAVSTDTSIGVKIHAAPATAQAGTIDLIIFYHG